MEELADDLATLTKLDEEILVEQLRLRYEDDQIYTYIGDILVAVNPFRPLEIYTRANQRLYNNIAKNEAPPHIYAVADSSYHLMLQSKRDQCCIVSGESGAGKTESAKYIVKHIIELCHGDASGALLEKQIIQVNPLLEAFGNAQTNMNDNSSRFGKYTELVFNPQGRVVGAQISEYLLEKSRVVRQQEGEQNFHIFYYIFESPDLEKYHLESPDKYKYISDDGETEEAEEMFAEVVQALEDVGFGDEERDMLWTVLSSILHIGNIEFTSSGEHDPAKVAASSDGTIDIVANLLQIKKTTLADALTMLVTVTRGETIKRNHTAEKASACRDAMAKALYGRIFGWIVSTINNLLHVKEEKGKPKTKEEAMAKNHYIGILDIFGFENFNTNSFEQWCINLANEQLQHFFNQHVFELELEEYAKEGIDGTNITYVDNKPLLDMHLQKPIGMFVLLDEESMFPRATDETLARKFEKNFKSSKYYVAATGNDCAFSIVHFAGQVLYETEGFLDKNRDSLANDIIVLLQGSGVGIVSASFLGEVTPTGTLLPAATGKGKKAKSSGSTPSTGKKAPTIGAQFTKSLSLLVDKMNNCRPHFVRCIKPNTGQSPWNYVDDFVMIQLRYTGMLETTRIRREGYAVRPKFAEFVKRYKMLGYGVLSKPPETKETCIKILEQTVDGWLIGKTKVFLRYFHMEELDRQLFEMIRKASVLQKCARGFMDRKKHKVLWEEAMKQKKLVEDFVEEGEIHGRNLRAMIKSLNDNDLRRLKERMLEEQMRATREAKARLEEAALKAETEQKRMDAEHAELKDTIDRSQRDYERLVTDLKRVLSSKDGLNETKRGEMEGILRDLEERLGAQQKTLEERMKEHQEVISGLQTSLRLKESHLSQSRAEREHVLKQLKKKEADGQGDTDAASNLRFKLKEQELRHEEKEADVQRITGQLERRKQMSQTVKIAYDGILSHINDLLRQKEAIADAYKAELERTRVQHEKDQKQMQNKYEERIKQLEKDVAQRDSTISYLETKLQSQTELLDRQKEEMNEAADQNRAALTQVETELAEVSAKYQQQQTLLDSTKQQGTTQVNDLKRQLADKDGELSKIKSNQERDIKELENKLRAKSKELQDLTVAQEGEMFQLKLQLQQKDNQVQAAVAEREGIVRELTSKVEAGEAQADAQLRVELRTAQLKVEEALAEVELHKSQIVSQTALLEAARAENSQTTAEYTRLLAEKEKLIDSRRGEHDTQVRALEEQLRSEQAELQRQLAAAGSELADARAEARKQAKLHDTIMTEKEDDMRALKTKLQMAYAEAEAEKVKLHSKGLQQQEAEEDMARLKARIESQSELFDTHKTETDSVLASLRELLQEKEKATESVRNEYKRIVQDLESELKEEKEHGINTRDEFQTAMDESKIEFEEAVGKLQETVFDRDDQIRELHEGLTGLEGQVAELGNQLSEKDLLLEQTMSSLDDAVSELEERRAAEAAAKRAAEEQHLEAIGSLEAQLAAQDEEKKATLDHQAKAIRALGRKKPGSAPTSGEATVDLLQYITILSQGAPAPADLMLSRYACKGWLVRPVGKNWQKRWFVFDLKQGKLTWYMNNRELRIHAKGNIPLYEVKDVLVPPSKDADVNNAILIRTKKRTHHVRASSPEAREVWLMAMKAILPAKK